MNATWAAMLSAANSSVAGLLQYGVFMQKGAIEAGTSYKTRSLLYLGQPIEGFKSETYKPKRQQKRYMKCLGRVLRCFSTPAEERAPILSSLGRASRAQ